MPEEAERLVRIPLPISLIRRIDGLIQKGVGGFRDRSDLIKEALEEYVLELSIEKAPELIDPITPFEEARWAEELDVMNDNPHVGPPANARRTLPEGTLGFLTADDVIGRDRTPPLDRIKVHLQRFELRYQRRGSVLESSVGRVRDEPMFGLHNRDYPSLWAALRIIPHTLDDLVEENQLREYLIDDAWEMGAELTRLEIAAGQKLSALLPTNKEKKPSSEDGFMNFAVGGATTAKDGEIQLSGPLFLWKAAGVEVRSIKGKDRLFVGLTATGYELLDAVAGLTPDSPHSEGHATRFFSYLKSHAPSDWWGFATILESIGKGIDRTELIKRFHKALLRDFPRQAPLEPWTAVQAATNTAGYVARAREWGLLELKQHRGRYLLTDFGREVSEKSA